MKLHYLQALKSKCEPQRSGDVNEMELSYRISLKGLSKCAQGEDPRWLRVNNAGVINNQPRGAGKRLLQRHPPGPFSVQPAVQAPNECPVPFQSDETNPRRLDWQFIQPCQVRSCTNRRAPLESLHWKS